MTSFACGRLRVQARVIQKKTSRLVQFEITEQTRIAIGVWLTALDGGRGRYWFPSRLRRQSYVSMRCCSATRSRKAPFAISESRWMIPSLSPSRSSYGALEPRPSWRNQAAVHRAPCLYLHLSRSRPCVAEAVLGTFRRDPGEPDPRCGSRARVPGDRHPLELKEDGKYIGSPDAGQDWHTDMTYREVPGFVNVLYGIRIPHRDGKPLGGPSFRTCTSPTRTCRPRSKAGWRK
jgi:hypothetical protein